eukprot:767964-Hanusia_phi.AAC.2
MLAGCLFLDVCSQSHSSLTFFSNIIPSSELVLLGCGNPEPFFSFYTSAHVWYALVPSITEPASADAAAQSYPFPLTLVTDQNGQSFPSPQHLVLAESPSLPGFCNEQLPTGAANQSVAHSFTDRVVCEKALLPSSILSSSINLAPSSLSSSPPPP